MTLAALASVGAVSRATPLRPNAVVVTAAQIAPAQDPVEDTVELIIRDNGFDIQEVRHAPGKFLLTANDRRSDKLQRLKLRLSREDGEQLRDIEVPSGAADWAEDLELAAGKYVVSEVNRLAAL